MNEFVKIGGNFGIKRNGLYAASSTGSLWLYKFKDQAMSAIAFMEPAQWVEI